MSKHYKVILGHLLRKAVVDTEEHREENLSMAQGTLGNAHGAVKDVLGMIRELPEDQDLEPWVISKITIAEDYLDTVRDYLSQRVNKAASHRVMEPIDSSRFPEREGLEGPFRLDSGLVVYYDPKEGLYYNPLTDIYLSHEEYEEHSSSR